MEQHPFFYYSRRLIELSRYLRRLAGKINNAGLTDFVGYGTIKKLSKVLKGKKLGAVINNGG